MKCRVQLTHAIKKDKYLLFRLDNQHSEPKVNNLDTETWLFCRRTHEPQTIGADNICDKLIWTGCSLQKSREVNSNIEGSLTPFDILYLNSGRSQFVYLICRKVYTTSFSSEVAVGCDTVRDVGLRGRKRLRKRWMVTFHLSTFYHLPALGHALILHLRRSSSERHVCFLTDTCKRAFLIVRSECM